MRGPHQDSEWNQWKSANTKYLINWVTLTLDEGYWFVYSLPLDPNSQIRQLQHIKMYACTSIREKSKITRNLNIFWLP